MAERVHLAAGILERDGAIVLVESRYSNHATTLWNLPGGRQRHGELLHETVVREFREETSLEVTAGALRYVAESYDRSRDTHYLSCVFTVALVRDEAPRLRTPPGEAHAVSSAWTPHELLAERLTVRVVREPLLTHLADPSRRYFAYDDAGISIDFSDDA